MNYWIFKYNPEKFDFIGLVKSGAGEVTWRVTRYKEEVKIGDIVFIWQTGRQLGIVAVLKTTSNVFYENNYSDRDKKFYRGSFNQQSADNWVYCEILETGKFLRSEFLRSVPGLENLSTFHGFQMMTNFAVTETEGEILYNLYLSTSEHK